MGSVQGGTQLLGLTDCAGVQMSRTRSALLWVNCLCAAYVRPEQSAPLLAPVELPSELNLYPTVRRVFPVDQQIAFVMNAGNQVLQDGTCRNMAGMRDGDGSVSQPQHADRLIKV